MLLPTEHREKRGLDAFFRRRVNTNIRLATTPHHRPLSSPREKEEEEEVW